MLLMTAVHLIDGRLIPGHYHAINVLLPSFLYRASKYYAPHVSFNRLNCHPVKKKTPNYVTNYRTLIKQCISVKWKVVAAPYYLSIAYIRMCSYLCSNLCICNEFSFCSFAHSSCLPQHPLFVEGGQKTVCIDFEPPVIYSIKT